MRGKRSSLRQLSLDFPHEEARSREDLLVTPANEQAVALMESWPDWPGSVVLLTGPAGSGKSHLAEIWRGQSGAASVRPAEVGPEALEAVRHSPLLIDDADSPHLDETGLFHLINMAKESGTHLLLVARRLPAHWGVQLPDLLSRLKAATILEIPEPDDKLLAGVIVKLCSDRQLIIEPHIVQFLACRIERSLSSVRQAVNRLDSMALERKVRITRGLAAEVITSMESLSAS